MTPGPHAFVSWWTANVVPLSRRDRLVVFLAGLLPDLDGLGMLYSREAYLTYHHILAHNLLGGLLLTGLAALFAQDRVRCATLTLLCWHLHLVCDYFGSAGPGPGGIWPLPYLFPLVGSWQPEGGFAGPRWYWNPWQWELNAWPNHVVLVISLIGWVYIAVRLNRTWFEFIWPKTDPDVCKTIRNWFGGGEPVEDWVGWERVLVRQSFVAVSCAAILACVVAAAQTGM